MGPPPPPPPPPPCLPAAILPSGGWKTTQTPRRDNNTVSAASKQVRPTVDSAALQHAAARLRKTGYHEQIRGDVSNLSDGRVAGENQRLPNGNRTYGSQFNQLGSDTSREPIHASPAYSVHADPVRVVRGCANPRINIQTTATPQPPAAHDLTSKNPYQTINKPFSESYIENRFESSDITRTRSPLPFTSTAQTQPHYRNVSPPQPYAPPHYENQPYTPFRNENDTYTLRTRSPPRSQPLSQYSPSDNYNYRTFTKETSRKEQHTTSPRTTELEWTTPYHPPSDHSPILDPHARIRDYATSHYVEEEPASHDYTRSVRRETNTRPAPQDFATSIRDHGLTVTQREANRYQSSTLRSHDGLPFDANRIYQQSYSGDEVDRLVTNMQTEMHVTRSPSGPAASRTVCVSCKSEITPEKPGCTALDQIFHVACFKCKKCDTRLAGASFYNIENDPICEKCYVDSLEKCSKCCKPISDRLLRAVGGTYHVDCFTCTNCSRTLDGVPFTTDAQNNVHCVPCFHEKFAPRCAVCQKGIVPQEGEKESVRVVAMDKSFHPSCYKCEDCGLLLSSKVEGAGCYPLDSHLYCKTCNMNRLRMQATA